MKVIKIGRSSSNDIIIGDVTVSSQHAIITISESREVRLKDLSSTNGTSVNGRRITGEVFITANDVIKVGNSVVEWTKYLSEEKKVKPQLHNENISTIKNRKNIGRTLGNDIVFDHTDVSSSHAQLIEKVNGEIVIADSGSTNGTYVNGHKISVQTLTKGDIILIANKYPLDWESIFGNVQQIPQSNQKLTSKHLRTVMIAIASIAAICIGIFFYIFHNKPTVNEPEVWKPEKIYATYKKSVVMIYGTYYYEVSAKGKIFAKVTIADKQLAKFDGSNPMEYTATGFFITKDGCVMTNRHVVCPWDYDDGIADKVKEYFQKYLAKLSMTNKSAYIEIQPLIGDVVVQGKLLTIGVFLNDSYVKSLKDLIPCTYIKDSGNKDVDLGLIQVNSKTLPAGVTKIVELSKASISDSATQVGKKVYTIGFPAGLTVGSTDKGIEANNQSGEITQLRGDIEFGHNISITHGASGSPIFNNYGQLVGIVNAGFLGISQSYNMAVKAKYAVELAK